MTLTTEQREQMLHAIGGKLYDGHRNHYVTDEPSEVWDPLVADGLATRRDAPFGAGLLYHVSPDGLARLRAEMPSDERKGWEVKVGDHEPTVARATTRSKARYVVAQEYADAFNTSIGEVFKMVRYVRRAPWADLRGHYGRDEMLTTSEAER